MHVCLKTFQESSSLVVVMLNLLVTHLHGVTGLGSRVSDESALTRGFESSALHPSEKDVHLGERPRPIARHVARSQLLVNQLCIALDLGVVVEVKAVCRHRVDVLGAEERFDVVLKAELAVCLRAAHAHGLAGDGAVLKRPTFKELDILQRPALRHVLGHASLQLVHGLVLEHGNDKILIRINVGALVKVKHEQHRSTVFVSEKMLDLSLKVDGTTA
mmetsp:Transcript_18124/g.43343  ORF Transcript_18124/g.43343 Transcript_18124/m.43343 type:complete len:217 (-) Transcript_18124:1-651(-)